MKVLLHLGVLLVFLGAVIAAIVVAQSAGDGADETYFYRDREALEQVVRCYQLAEARQVLIDHYRATTRFRFAKPDADDPDLVRAPLYDVVADSELKEWSDACFRDLQAAGFIDERVCRQLLRSGWINLAPAIEVSDNPAVVMEEERWFYIFWVDGSTQYVWKVGEGPDAE